MFKYSGSKRKINKTAVHPAMSNIFLHLLLKMISVNNVNDKRLAIIQKIISTYEEKSYFTYICTQSIHKMFKHIFYDLSFIQNKLIRIEIVFRKGTK